MSCECHKEGALHAEAPLLRRQPHSHGSRGCRRDGRVSVAGGNYQGQPDNSVGAGGELTARTVDWKALASSSRGMRTGRVLIGQVDTAAKRLIARDGT